APLWILPPLFFLWANTHGSWSLGLVLFVLVGISGLVQGSWGRADAVRWSPRQLKQYIITGIASVAALFLNTYGWKPLSCLLAPARNKKLTIGRIEQRIQVPFPPLRGKLFFLLRLGLLLPPLFPTRRWDLAEVLMLLFALYSGLTYIRFLVLL